MYIFFRHVWEMCVFLGAAGSPDPCFPRYREPGILLVGAELCTTRFHPSSPRPSMLMLIESSGFHGEIMVLLDRISPIFFHLKKITQKNGD